MNWAEMTFDEKFIVGVFVFLGLAVVILLMVLVINLIIDRFKQKEKEKADSMIPVIEITGEIVRTISEIDDVSGVNKKVVINTSENECEYDIPERMLKKIQNIKTATFFVKNNRVVKVSFEDQITT